MAEKEPLQSGKPIPEERNPLDLGDLLRIALQGRALIASSSLDELRQTLAKEVGALFPPVFVDHLYLDAAGLIKIVHPDQLSFLWLTGQQRPAEPLTCSAAIEIRRQVAGGYYIGDAPVMDGLIPTQVNISWYDPAASRIFAASYPSDNEGLGATKDIQISSGGVFVSHAFGPEVDCEFDALWLSLHPREVKRLRVGPTLHIIPTHIPGSTSSYYPPLISRGMVNHTSLAEGHKHNRAIRLGQRDRSDAYFRERYQRQSLTNNDEEIGVTADLDPERFRLTIPRSVFDLTLPTTLPRVAR